MADHDETTRREALASVRTQLALFEKIPAERAFTDDERRQYERLCRLERHLSGGLAEWVLASEAAPSGPLERRRQGSGAVDSLTCRLCGKPTPLDRRHMTTRRDMLVLSCTSCRAEFPIRRSDEARLTAQYAHLRRRGA